MQPKKLKFNQHLVQPILDGHKTATWRLRDDKDLGVDDVLQLVNATNGEVFAVAQIDEVLSKRLGELTEADKAGHEPFTSDEEMYATFKQFYGEVGPSSVVKIVRFHLLNDEQIADLEDLGMPVAEAHSTREVKLYTDGGSRGNPGPSALGYVITDMNDTVLADGGAYLGITTNNQAEYQAVKAGLEACQKMGARTVWIYMDSLLVVNQMKGIFKIKNRDLWPIHEAIRELSKEFESVSFTHIPRELNKKADAKVNETLDAEAKS